MWMNPEEAAKQLNIHQATLRRRGARGEIERDGGKYWVPMAEDQKSVEGEGLLSYAPTDRVSEEDIRRSIRAAEHAKPVQVKPSSRGVASVPKKKDKTARPHMVVWISDVHVPFHDVRACTAWLDFVKDQQPDEIILGGDILELESCSSHGGVAEPLRLVQEAEAGESFCRALRKTVPAAKITYLEGNHESRLSRVVVNTIPTLDGAITIPNLLHLDELGIEYVKDKYQVGKLLFVHGLWTTKYHAATHLERFGVSVAYGHTHRPQMVTRATAASPLQAGFGMPCMRTLEPDWMHGAPAGWGHGFGVFYFFEDGTFTPYMPLIVNGRFVWDGKVYSG